MTDLVRYAVADGVAVLTMDNPPLNALGHGLREALAQAFDAAEADEGVAVICLMAAGRSWPVGADIREFGQPARRPTLPDLCQRIQTSQKPVIAALHGTALGGGLELALVAALRVAADDCEVGLPEVSLGLLPGAGGTQRLPRLIGAAPALELMLSGRRIGAKQALALGLVDRITNGSLLDMVLSLAAAHVSGRKPLPTAGQRLVTGQRDQATYLEAVGAARAIARPAHDRAAPRIIDCVEAAILLPESAGLAFERTAFEDLLLTPEARALRYAFLAERRGARSLPALAPDATPVITRVSIVGGGAIGCALAARLAESSVPVTLIEADQTSLRRAQNRVTRSLQAAGAVGGIQLLSLSTSPAAASDADLVIEAANETQAVKQGVLNALAGVVAPDTPILSISCAIDPAQLAEAAGGQGRHATLWLCEPVRRAELVEMVAGTTPGPSVPAAQVFARIMGWRLLGQAHGPLAPIYLCGLRDLADRLVTAGMVPFAVDRAVRGHGLAIGPFEWRDIFGPDHVLSRLDFRRPGVDVRDALADWLRGQDRLGRRSGSGYHIYADAAGKAAPDPEVEALLTRLRPSAARLPAEIADLMVAGLANTGAWALSDGRARCPSDFDLVAMAHGYPRWRGGPMRNADEVGALRLRAVLRAMAEAGDPFWEPAPIWDELIKNGQGFGALDPA